MLSKISPCLWFDNDAEAAAKLYTETFPHSRIVAVTHFGHAGFEQHRRPAGSVMTVDFELEGQSFTALNGGPIFKFTPAVSFQVECATQEELDHYWEKLREGGDPEAQQCGWLADRFGVSWQIVPAQMAAWMSDADPARRERVMAAFMEMKKLEIAVLERAAAG